VQVVAFMVCRSSFLRTTSFTFAEDACRTCMMQWGSGDTYRNVSDTNKPGLSNLLGMRRGTLYRENQLGMGRVGGRQCADKEEGSRQTGLSGSLWLSDG
jgi:hypothetical protein